MSSYYCYLQVLVFCLHAYFLTGPNFYKVGCFKAHYFPVWTPDWITSDQLTC